MTDKTDRNDWEINQLKKESANHDKRIGALEVFQISTTEKMITIFKNIDEIKTSNQWWSRSFIYLLGGAIFSAVASLLVWLIQN